MLKESKRLDKEISVLDKKIKNLPEGKLVCTINGNRYKWYNSKPAQMEYIPKRNRSLAQLLAKKKYLLLQKEEKVKERMAIDFYLRHCLQGKYKSKELLNKPGYEELLAPFYKDLPKELDEWVNADYETNNTYQDNLRYSIGKGRFVRSKAEMMIAHELIERKIPFRYECALELHSGVFYPDFTIRHPRTGEVLYWEHMGLIEKSDYREIALSKIRRYAENGIFPGEQLILSFETNNNPLNYETINAMIDLYLT